MERIENVKLLSASVSNFEGVLTIETSEKKFKHLTRDGEEFSDSKFNLSFAQFKLIVGKDTLFTRMLVADIPQKHYDKAAALVSVVVADATATIEGELVSEGDEIPQTDGLKAERDMWVYRITDITFSSDGERKDLLRMAKAIYSENVATASQVVIKPLL